MSATETFRALAEAAVDDVLQHEPTVATWAGDHRYDDRLPDLSDSGVAEFARVLRQHRRALDALALDELNTQDRVDAEILGNHLDRMLFAAEVTRDHEWDLLAHDVGNPLYLLSARDTTPLDHRVRATAARLSAIPEFLATTRRTVTRAPRAHAETALGQLPGVRALVTTELDRMVAADTSLAALVDGPREGALAALDEHERWLEQLVETADGDPRLGADVFTRKLSLTLDAAIPASEVAAHARAALDATTEELHETAREFLARIGEPTDGDRTEVIQAALDAVARDVPTDDTVVAICEQAMVEATDKVRELGIVTIPPDPMRIEVMPEFRRGIAVAYCDSPGALEEGGLAYVAISPTPSDWPPERIESFYREYNTALLRDLIVHEAMPGHMLQIAHARRFTGSTRVRKLFSSSSFIEGWAVQTERMMSDAGFGGLPVRVQYLKMQLRMAINTLLDVGVHAEGMTEQAALELMMTRGFQEEGEAVGKWRRALLTSCQLSTYFVGQLELDEVVPAARRSGSLDGVLAHGNPPPRHLATLLSRTAARDR